MPKTKTVTLLRAIDLSPQKSQTKRIRFAPKTKLIAFSIYAPEEIRLNIWTDSGLCLTNGLFKNVDSKGKKHIWHDVNFDFDENTYVSVSATNPLPVGVSVSNLRTAIVTLYFK